MSAHTESIASEVIGGVSVLDKGEVADDLESSIVFNLQLSKILEPRRPYNFQQSETHLPRICITESGQPMSIRASTPTIL